MLPSPRFRDELIEWVQSGGRLIVFDTPDVDEFDGQQSADVVWLDFGAQRAEQKDQPLRLADGSGTTPLQASCEIQGGEALAFWGQVPIAVRTTSAKAG